MVVPPPVFQRRALDLLDSASRPSAVDQLGLAAGFHALCEGVILGVSDGPY